MLHQYFIGRLKHNRISGWSVMSYGNFRDSARWDVLPAEREITIHDEMTPIFLHRYCIFCPPRFSNLACLLLACGWGTPAAS